MARLVVLVVFFVLLSCGNGSVIPNPDWLIDGNYYKTEYNVIGQQFITLSNGLISRKFILNPNFATVGYDELHTAKTAILRALSPEAIVSINGIEYPIGGLSSSMTRAYFNQSALFLNTNAIKNSFHYADHTVHVPEANYPYSPRRHAPEDITWPPKGVRLDVLFKPPVLAAEQLKGVTVTVHYEMYDNIPALKKWITVQAGSSTSIEVLFNSVEQLAVNQPWARLDPNSDTNFAPVYHQGYYWLYIETTWPHGTRVNWQIDPSQPKSPGSMQPLVNVNYSVPYAVPLNAGQNLESFGVVEIAVGSSDPSRAALTRNRVFRALQPQIQENPLFFHMTRSDSKSVRGVIDQMAEAGFELMIYSFGAGIDMESTNESYIKKVAEDVAYARSKGIEVGSYDLIVWTRHAPLEYQTVTADGKHTGNACIASAWYEHLRDNIISFMTKTGMTNIETDGPYPGYSCYSKNHSHHVDVDDSVYRQTELQAQLYEEFAKQGFYVHQPDSYFYMGAQKTAMGYNENQFSLPRQQDLSVSRQGMYDDVLWKPPTQGWMFLPLTVYHGGGEAATFEPLSDHAQEYDFALAQYLGAGVAACYRGYRLYDSLLTKNIVTKWVTFYKRYRSILISDIVHIKRPDMQGLDGFVHVNPKTNPPALSMVYNPTDQVLSKNWTVPLYYSGLSGTSVSVSVEDGKATAVPLDRFVQASVPLSLQPRSATWLTFTRQ